MKKFLGFLVFGVLCITFFVTSPHAQETQQMETKTSSASSYMLPYPGILPDNPLYKIKLLRDKIWIAITKDPVKKSRLYLLFADKKIAAAKALAQKNEFTLARNIALKGENEFTELTFYYKNNSIKPDTSFFTTLTLASQKHREVLEEIKALVPQEEKAIYTTIEEFSKRNEEEFGLIINQ
jgi:hypothetical protein